MATPDLQHQFDVILIGGGLATSAAGRLLANAGKSVAMISGAGRSRSLDADGGLVDAGLIERAFGPNAPLDQAVQRARRFTATDVTSAPGIDAIQELPERRSFRRLELERWALDRAIDAGAVYLDGFVEGQVRSSAPDRWILTEESETASVGAETIVLCEGSDPRIAMHAGLRPDYPAEEQIHFARAIIARPSPPLVQFGRTRTSWGMPIGITVIPLGSMTLVTVDSRIENVMRAAKSTQEALLELLTSPLGDALGLRGERLHTGIELGAMRSDATSAWTLPSGLLVGLDASGMLDMRNIDRADITLLSGLELARHLISTPERAWSVSAGPLLERIRAPDPHWHDSRGTGFIEESIVANVAQATVARVTRGLANRFKKR